MPRAQRPPAVLAVAALAAAAVTAVAGAAASSGAQDAGRILFASDVAYYRAHASLHTIGVDGREGRLLVSNVDNTRSVQWSPDGTRIAYFRNGAILVVPARGGKPRVAGRVTDGADTQFSWSPDGTRIAYFDFDIRDTLVVVRIGSRMLVKRYTTHGGGGERPAWSPDGKRIAFIRDRRNAGDLSALDLANGHVSVLIRGLVGANLAWSPDGRTIAYDLGTTLYLADLARHTHRELGLGNTPSWSPDGRKIAANEGLDNVDVLDARTGRRVHVSGYFETNLRQSDDPPSWTPDSRRLAVPIRDDVYVVRADGRARRAVTHHGHATLLVTVPSLSPDGKRVAYVTVRNVGQGDDLYSIRPDGSGLQQLTKHSYADQPVWSPDRSRIAFVQFTSGLTGNVLVMGAGGGGARLVAAGLQPAWTPDGRSLAYVRDGDIYTVAADGGPEQLLIGGPTLDSDPAWSPDGKRIAFARRAAAGAPADVWTAAADGSGAVQLTRVGDAHDTCNAVEGFSPAWSPDGTEIAYVRGIGINSTCFDHFFLMSIRAIHPDGSGDRLVTTGGGKGQGGASDPAWSPDSAHLAFTISADNPTEGQYVSGGDLNYRIGVVDRSGRGLRVLFHLGDSQDPDWR